MLKWYQEPLVHFLILGIFLFFIVQTNALPMVNQDSKTITIKEQDIEKLVTYWNKKYNINPTQEELDTLLKFYIENEILYTEALKMKLDEHDEAIKQLLIDKLKYVVSEPVNVTNITDEELEKFFKQNKELFLNKEDISISFGHIYFNPKEYSSKDPIEKKANSIYENIKDEDFNQTYANYGDAFYKGSYFSKMTEKELASIFSHSFVQSLQKLPQKCWSHPIKSGYGIHLIYIEHIYQTEMSFHTIKEKIKNRYIIHKSRENYENFYKDLKEKYQIIIEPYSLKNEN